jgi:hypothetical protein
MAKAILSAGEIKILVAEAHADSAAKATEGFAIANSNPALNRTGSQPHDAAPLSRLKLHSICGFLVRPQQNNRLIFERYRLRYLAVHKKPPLTFALIVSIEW